MSLLIQTSPEATAVREDRAFGERPKADAENGLSFGGSRLANQLLALAS